MLGELNHNFTLDYIFLNILTSVFPGHKLVIENIDRNIREIDQING